MSRRPTPKRALSDRERAVLRDVDGLRFVTGGQLARLHFAEGTPIGRQRRAQAVLRRLTEDGYLHRLPRRIGGPGSGSARFVYQLGYRGQRVARPDRVARTPEEIGALFVEHSMAVSEVVVGLAEAERSGLCRELQIETEPDCWRRFLGPHGGPLILKPDLGVWLASGSSSLVWFVEVDRATEGLRRIRSKASHYLDYWRSGTEQQRLGAFPRVLWSVPDDRRATAIARTLRELPEPPGAMFAVATAEETTRALLGQPTRKEGGEK